MKVLLTGGSGNLGHTLVPKLLDEGDTPIILDIRAPLHLQKGAVFKFGQNLAPAVPGIRPINAGRRNENDLVDAGGSGTFENLEGAAHVGCGGLRPWVYTPSEADFEVGFHLVKRCIEVEEIVGVFLAAIFVDTVPSCDVNNAIAAAKYLGQPRAVQNGALDSAGAKGSERKLP